MRLICGIVAAFLTAFLAGLGLLLLFIALFGVPAEAQNTMTVTAGAVKNAAGQTLASGQACFAPVNNAGTPMSYQAPGGGQTVTTPVCAAVTAGALSISLPNTNLTTPVNVCFHLTVRDLSTGQLVLGNTPLKASGYDCVQPNPNAGSWCSGSSCNLDNFPPNLQPQQVVTAPVQPTITDTGNPYVSVTASNIQNALGQKLASGQACFTAVNNVGQPIPFQGPSGGQTVEEPVCAPVVNGAFSIAQLANTAQTNPRNVCYHLTVTDASSNQVVLGKTVQGFPSGYDCVQTAGSSNWCSSSICNLDNYPPNLAPQMVSQVLSGAQGPAGPSVCTAGGCTLISAGQRPCTFAADATGQNAGCSSYVNPNLIYLRAGYSAALDPLVSTVYPSTALGIEQSFVWTQPQATPSYWMYYTGRAFWDVALHGGSNIYTPTYGNYPGTDMVANYGPLDVRLWKYTPGNSWGANITHNCLSLGDCLGLYVNQFVRGGFSAASGEGAEAIALHNYEDSNQWRGTISAIAGNTMTAAPGVYSDDIGTSWTTLGGIGTQAEGLYLIDIDRGYGVSGHTPSSTGFGPSSAGTVSAITYTSASVPLHATGSGTAWPTKTVDAQLGSAVTSLGSVTVTPTSFVAGSMASITTSSTVCVAGTRTFEWVVPSTVTSNTFTAVFHFPHQATDIISVGGLCGYVIALDADAASNALWPEINADNPIIRVLPIVRSNSTTDLEFWQITPNGGYYPYPGRWYSGGIQTYHLYPAVRVNSVVNGTSLLSDTLTADTPIPSSWQTGDIVLQPHYYQISASAGYIMSREYQPRYFPGLLQGLDYFVLEQDGLAGAPGGSVGFLGVVNGTPRSVYTSSFTPPSMFDVHGPYNFAIVDSCADSGCIHTGGINVQDAFKDYYVFSGAISGGNNAYWRHSPTDKAMHIGQFGGADVRIEYATGNLSTPGSATVGGKIATQSVGTPYGGVGTYVNQALYSQFDAPSLPTSWSDYGHTWTPNCSPSTITADSSDVTDPLGGYTALKMVTPGSWNGSYCGGAAQTGLNQNGISLAAGAPAVVAVWARTASGTATVFPYVANLDNNSNGCPLAAQNTVTTTWTRVYCYKTSLPAAATSFSILSSTPGVTLYLWGVSVENDKVIPGPYVRTAASAANGTGLVANQAIVGTLQLTGLPSSCTGQPTGQAWNNSGNLGVCP
jgi:hypothetical protein